MRVFTGLGEIKAAAGEHLGYSDYQVITQADIDAFAAKIRVGATLSCSVRDVPGGAQIGIAFVWEIEGQAKPACVAEMLIRCLTPS